MRLVAGLLVRAVLLPLKLVFGFDAFISYARRDGAAYAESLQQNLKPLKSRVDLQESTPSERLPLQLKIALLFSKVLVVIGTTEAMVSPAVQDEIRIFLTWSRGPVLLVRRGGVLEGAVWWDLVRGLERLDDISVGDAATVSETVKTRVGLKVGFWRTSRTQTLVAVLSAMILAASTAVALWIGRDLDSTRQQLGAAARDLRAVQDESRRMGLDLQNRAKELQEITNSLEVARHRLSGRWRLSGLESLGPPPEFPFLADIALKYTSDSGAGEVRFSSTDRIELEPSWMADVRLPWAGTLQLVVSHLRREPRDPHRYRYESQLPKERQRSVVEVKIPGRPSALVTNPDFVEHRITDCSSKIETVGDILTKGDTLECDIPKNKSFPAPISIRLKLVLEEVK